ncbi:unnamed protein product [Arctogadus glacialis]
MTPYRRRERGCAEREGTATEKTVTGLNADRASRKDLSQVMGNVRVRVRALRKKRVETAPTALTEQEEEKPFRPFRTEPLQTHQDGLGRPKAVITTDTPPPPEAEEEGEATQQAGGNGLRPRTMYKNDTIKLVFEYQ